MVSVDPKYVKQIKGREFIVFEGLLDMAHQEGLNLVETELVQRPTEENGHTAIAHAKVRTERGTFTGIGDASPASVKAHIVPHLIRMSSTRAIARALRWSTNVGRVAIVELGETETVDGDHPSDIQIARINELALHSAIGDDDMAHLEETLPRMNQAEADDLIAILEVKIEAVEASGKAQGNGQPTPTAVVTEGDGEPLGDAQAAPGGLSLGGNRADGEGATSEEPPATPKQIGLIQKTLDEDGQLLTEAESQRIENLLSGQLELSKRKASDLLDYLLGKSVKNPVSGSWEKVSVGILRERRTGKVA